MKNFNLFILYEPILKILLILLLLVLIASVMKSRNSEFKKKELRISVCVVGEFSRARTICNGPVFTKMF